MRLNQCFPNVFAYCDNNPVNNCDPSGHFAFAIPVIAFVAVVAVVAAVVIAAAYYSSTPAGQRSWNGLCQAYSQHIQNCINTVENVARTIRTFANASKTKATSQAKGKARTKSVAKTNDKPQPTYLRAKATHPGANVYLDQPINLQQAAELVKMGGDVYAKNAADAEYLCTFAGGGFSGPTNDNNPLSAMHYHLTSYILRGHVFYGDDPNLHFVNLFN